MVSLRYWIPLVTSRKTLVSLKDTTPLASSRVHAQVLELLGQGLGVLDLSLGLDLAGLDGVVRRPAPAA